MSSPTDTNQASEESMKIFSTFSGIGGLFTILNSVILVKWTEGNINESTNENGRLRTESMCWLWNEPDTMHKHQSKKQRKSARIKNIASKSGLMPLTTTGASVFVVAKKQLSFFASTISTIMEQNTGKVWQTNQ